MENTVTEIKHSLLLNRRFEQGEERIRKLEDMSIEMIQSKKQKEKRMKKNEQRLRDLWGTPKNTNICIMEVPEGQERERKGQKEYLKK